MKQHLAKFCAVGLVVGVVFVGLTQSRVTITGGPGSDSSGAPGTPAQVTGGLNGSGASGVTEERVRQIVREELQRAGVLPPPGMNTGPFGVAPNPLSPRGTNGNRVPPPTNGVVGRPAGGSRAVGVRNPSETVGRAVPGTTGNAPTPGGASSVGVISGGSSAVGVATPSGAGASRSGAASSTGTSGSTAAGTPRGGSTGR